MHSCVSNSLVRGYRGRLTHFPLTTVLRLSKKHLVFHPDLFSFVEVLYAMLRLKIPEFVLSA